MFGRGVHCEADGTHDKLIDQKVQSLKLKPVIFPLRHGVHALPLRGEVGKSDIMLCEYIRCHDRGHGPSIRCRAREELVGDDCLVGTLRTIGIVDATQTISARIGRLRPGHVNCNASKGSLTEIMWVDLSKRGYRVMLADPIHTRGGGVPGGVIPINDKRFLDVKGLRLRVGRPVHTGAQETQAEETEGHVV